MTRTGSPKVPGIRLISLTEMVRRTTSCSGRSEVMTISSVPVPPLRLFSLLSHTVRSATSSDFRSIVRGLFAYPLACVVKLRAPAGVPRYSKRPSWSVCARANQSP
jgi:hypothetical protein